MGGVCRAVPRRGSSVSRRRMSTHLTPYFYVHSMRRSVGRTYDPNTPTMLDDPVGTGIYTRCWHEIMRSGNETQGQIP